MRIISDDGILEIFDLTLSTRFDKPEDECPDIIYLKAKFLKDFGNGDIRYVDEPIAYFRVDKDEDKCSRAFYTFDLICGDLLKYGYCKLFNNYENCQSMSIVQERSAR